MRDWWIDGETGLPQEAAEKIKKKISSTSEGVLIGEALLIGLDGIKPVKPLSLGSSNQYFLDVVSANITIPSKTDDKSDIVEADMNGLASLRLPTVKKYVRKGRPELGFLAEEMPAEVRTSQGDIDLKALIAVLTAKVKRLEEAVLGGGGTV
ncbi:MAG: hypothetical protein QXH12_04550 [Candidatus Caldarchaeum sp.]|uniref:Uncharacterized protein n=1 Tax=Caldiarchaeum subterraneum TaxID=311458 RepID=A0A7C5LBQ9_CALS0